MIEITGIDDLFVRTQKLEEENKALRKAMDDINDGKMYHFDPNRKYEARGVVMRGLMSSVDDYKRRLNNAVYNAHLTDMRSNALVREIDKWKNGCRDLQNEVCDLKKQLEGNVKIRKWYERYKRVVR